MTRFRRGQRGILAAWAAAVLTATVSAALLAPGGSVPLTGLAAPAGVVVRNVVHPFEVDDAGGTLLIAGSVQEIVVRKADGTHVFMWRVFDTLVDSPEGITEVSVTDYTDTATFVEWAPGVGDAPSPATRTGDGARITYDFSGNPIFETEESVFFYADTDADAWEVSGTLTLEVQSGNSATIEVASPVVDGTPPEGHIDSRSPLECVCDPATITGVADDPQGFDHYTLEYREISDPNWTLITQSFVPVPAPGGTLAVWNVGGLPQGWYFLRLTVENTMGDTTVDTTIVWVDQVFDNLTFAGPAPGTVVGGDVCPHGIIDDHCGETYTVDYSADGVTYLPVDAPSYVGPKINQTFAVWDSTAVADGSYFLQVTAMDPCGHEAQETHEVIVDNTPPTAIITDPVNCQCVDGLYEVYGTADDANLASWVLQYAGGNNNQWVTIASGTDPVINGLLGTWDTTGLPDCPHALRLLVSDSAVVDCNGAIHHHSVFLVSVNVGCTECLGDTDHDGDVDVDDLVNVIMHWGICPI